MAGRPCKYEEKVKPYFNKIKQWLEYGATEEQVAKNLGIAYSSYNKYKTLYAEFAEVIKSVDRAPLVDKLRGALVQKALGFDYKEKKEYIREDPATGEKTKYIEITTKKSLPDVTAIFGALNVYDPEYVKDKKNYELKKEELSLRKALAKANNFDLDLDDEDEGS